MSMGLPELTFTLKKAAETVSPAFPAALSR